jgi:hypothetical protein
MLTGASGLYRQIGRQLSKYSIHNPVVFSKNLVICKCNQNRHSLARPQIHKSSIYFVYDETSYFLGSVILRTFQTAALLGISLEIPVHSVSFRKLLSLRPNNSIIVFSKTAVRLTSFDLLFTLQNARNTLVADPLDSNLNNVSSSFSKVITTDQSINIVQANLNLPMYYLPHAPDWRLSSTRASSDGTKCVYLGSRSKYILKNSSKYLVTSHYTADYSLQINKMPKWVKGLEDFRFHLTASRPVSVNVARPSTKLVTALMLGAIPIVGNWELGTMAIIGNDYPYVLSSPEANQAYGEIHELTNSKELLSKYSRLKFMHLEELYCPIQHTNKWVELFNAA